VQGIGAGGAFRRFAAVLADWLNDSRRLSAVLQLSRLLPLNAALSDWSFGFRPGRNAHQAIKQVQATVKDGYRTAVDIDLAKFFDTVNHDVLMGLLRRSIADKRLLSLIGRYLRAGVLVGEHIEPSDIGTPQGGPLSPLLANILLHQLDQELERRGHRFARYADDLIVLVKSKRAGERVMRSITRYLAMSRP
jgi:RNA-directed DNA polymerase